jgi:hypothetical protein
METKAFVIPVENVAKMDADVATFIARMERLAKRKGVVFTPPIITKSAPRAIPQGRNPITDEKKPDLIVIDVTLQSEPAKVPGYEFVATLEHIDQHGTIVRVSPVVKAAESEFVAYRKAEPNCEHCGFKRNRADTFVVRSETTGLLIQVGRNCLKDFFGHDPSWAIKMSEFLGGLNDLFTGAGEYSGFGTPSMFSLWDFMPWVASCVRLDGWTSRTNARLHEGLKATADAAFRFAFPVRSDYDDYRFKRERDAHQPTENDIELARKAVEFVREKFEAMDVLTLNDYEHNLSVCVNADIVDHRKAGIVASLITYYNRDLAKREETQKDADSNYFGVIGKRAVYDLKLVKVFSTQGQWGTTTIYKFKDVAGNIAIWFSSAVLEKELEIGTSYKIKGTVKAHNDRDGVKQTILSRCVVEA